MQACGASGSLIVLASDEKTAHRFSRWPSWDRHPGERRRSGLLPVAGRNTNHSRDRSSELAEPPIATDPYQTSQIWPRGGRSSLTGALLDRLTHRIHILEANGEGHRLRESRPG